MKSLKLLASAALFAFAATAFAGAGQYDDFCVTGMSFGKKVETDCSLNVMVDGKTYCFSGPEAKAMYDKDQKGTIAKADTNWIKMNKH